MATDMRLLVRTFALALAVVVLGACGVIGGSTASPSAGDASTLARGIAAHNANRIDEAISLYYQTLAQDPTNKFALYNLGQIENNTKKNAVAAEAWYRLALESDKAMPEALLQLGILRQRVGDSIESASLLRRLIAVDPNNAVAHFNLGLALRSLGQTADANTEFATAQRLDASLVPPTGTAKPSPTR